MLFYEGYVEIKTIMAGAEKCGLSKVSHVKSSCVTAGKQSGVRWSGGWVTHASNCKHCRPCLTKSSQIESLAMTGCNLWLVQYLIALGAYKAGAFSRSISTHHTPLACTRPALIFKTRRLNATVRYYVYGCFHLHSRSMHVHSKV